LRSTKCTEIIVKCDSKDREGPSYSLIIDGDGNVEYNGLRNVKTLGKRLIKISTEDLNRIIHEFQDLYFFSFQDSYESSVQHDTRPQISVSLRLKDKYKNVRYTEGSRVPHDLKVLVKQVEKITKADYLSGIL
jgi:hypothetical protein